MPRRRLRRQAEKARRHALPATIVRGTARAERLAYTRAQAAEALGISRSTFNRRVLPYVETVEMPWGTRLIPADELERLLAERRRPPKRSKPSLAPPGRPLTVPKELAEHIRAERATGKSLAEIARQLNASQTPTAHGGAQWWPSTVRAVLFSTSACDADLQRQPGPDVSADRSPSPTRAC